MPSVICSWLSGTSDSSIIIPKARTLIKNRFFASRREARLVEKALEIMFNDRLLAQHTVVITDGVALLKLAIAYNNKNTHYIFSNWNARSFNCLLHSAQVKEVFSLFSPDNIIISGAIGTAKPHRAMFEYPLNKYGIQAKDCLVIDDQEENIQAARKHGMKGLLLQNNNYRELQKELAALGLL